VIPIKQIIYYMGLLFFLGKNSILLELNLNKILLITKYSLLSLIFNG